MPPIADDRFAAEVEQRAGWVLAFFAADWCGPSRQMKLNISATANALAGRLRVVEVDYDRSPAAAERCEVRSLPTTLLFFDRRVARRTVGSMLEAQFRRWVEGMLLGKE